MRTVGKPSELVAAAKLDALPLWARWQARVAETLAQRGPAGLVALQQELASDDAIADSLFTAAMQADMGGQLFVRAVEVPETLPQTAALDALPDARPSFLRLPFREALQAFLRKRVVTPEEFAAMEAEMRRRSFFVTRLSAEQVVAHARAMLEADLRNGGTLRGFIDDVRNGDASLGLVPTDDTSAAYLETVYRTNVQQAYGQGRLRQLDAPAVLDARPWCEYRTARDARVRPSHAALDRLIFNRADDPNWRRYAPPLGFSCRCSVVTLRANRVDPARVISSANIPPGVGPEPDWTGPGTT